MTVTESVPINMPVGSINAEVSINSGKSRLDMLAAAQGAGDKLVSKSSASLQPEKQKSKTQPQNHEERKSRSQKRTTKSSHLIVKEKHADSATPDIDR